MDTSSTIEYSKVGFDNSKYLKLQREKIVERIDNFKGGRLYLEIGGKLLHDPHAARVLPGFLPDNKKRILKKLASVAEIIFCISAQAIKDNRQLKSKEEKYTESSLEMIKSIEIELGVKPKIALNLCTDKSSEEIEIFVNKLKDEGYKVYRRYVIEGYPSNVDKILSNKGYGMDEYIHVKKPLVIVTGAASNSGKMSTCLGQIYHDKQHGLSSGYAKYETFPIWSLPLEHPVNLAYEAATADIGDYNVIDKYHMEAYNTKSVNYNRDVDAFEILKLIGEKLVSEDSFIKKYKSPTDMGINHAGSAIINDEVVCIASLREIRRRANWYSEIAARGQGNIDAIERCLDLTRKAKRYIEMKGYNTNLEL